MSQRQQLHLLIQPKDRLSSLPEEVLEHIISYLPTKDAVATTFLSKTWKSQSLWRSQMNLCFDDKTFPHPFSFSQFVHSVITNRDNTLPIHSFHLKSHRGFCYSIDLYNFVYAAITLGVQNLSINLCSIRRTLPTFVLTTKTLSVLKLKEISLNEMSYEDDPCFDLPSLKVLHLESVAFTFHKHIRKLLSACPILEELETKDLTVKKVAKELRINRDVPSLSNLVRANISGGYIGLDWLHNVHHLSIKLVDTFHNYADSEWKDPEIVPECLLSHLTTCSLRNYSHTNCEFQFAKYIMENSRVLSTMTIQIAKSIESDTKIQMLKELYLCPMNSATCELLLI
ncbi:hypothetical protein TSUD_306610 [Trifolium subterraneum]|uniref:F-box domain-containing protein n=1 Tax=Trifolium subterraneum TaxID=3900 RepID=A0A2Z6NZB1_TRISU|nr:hypothetical protein TSUD_306610 [Trifolium subterraneum]